MRYGVSDVAFRVVGTGSVGLRNYLILLHGNGSEALVLQAKEASSRTPWSTWGRGRWKSGASDSTTGCKPFR
jgi:uncharacterized protein (DUF2252 family)